MWQMGLLLTLLTARCSCEIHYIVPSQDDFCYAGSCLNLSQLADLTSNYTDSNTAIIFLGGNHTLGKSISITNRVAYSMTTTNDTDSNSVIYCKESASFNFCNISHMYISKLSFVGCHHNTFESVRQFIIEESIFTGNDQDVLGGMRLSDVGFLSYLNSIMTKSWDYMDSISDVSFGGALIIRRCTLRLHGCKFEQNTANIGGAIFAALGSNITINSSSFISNQATGCKNELCFGSALFLDETGTVIIHNSTFQNNTSQHDGGTIIVFNSTLTLSKCNFVNNVAIRYGGAIAVFQNSALVLNASTVNNNIANWHGGALYMYNSSLLVINSTLDGNRAQNGGALYASRNSNVTIISSSYLHNRANSRYGGVIFQELNSTALILSSRFYNNFAVRCGGVISAQNWSSINISHSTFSSNSATFIGGAIHMRGYVVLTVSDCLFVHNFAGSEGGVFDAFNLSTISVRRSTFTNNTSESHGGVSSLRFGSNFSTEECTFLMNRASDHGAVVYAAVRAVASCNKCNFSENSANHGGVLSLVINSAVTIESSMFRNNTVQINGAIIFLHALSTAYITYSFLINNIAVNDGIVFVSDHSYVSLHNSDIFDNVVGHDGGVVYVYDYSTTEISKCNFTNNSGDNSGGTLYGRKFSNITVSDSTINNSTAHKSGGGMHAQQESQILIQNSNFTQNTADYGGVVIVYERSSVKITNSTFRGNKGNIEGGVFAAYKSSSITAQSSYFFNNTANFGGISLLFNECSLRFVNINSLNNTAQFGGSIRALLKNEINISQSTFRHNLADRGGVLYIQDSKISVKMSSLDENMAKYYGGVLYGIESCIEIEASSFDGSWAKYDGGTICVDNSIVKSYNNTYTNNSADEDGGVILAFGRSNISIKDSEFANNLAEGKGGVIFAQESIVDMLNCNVKVSKAKTGGVIYAQQESKINISETYFSNNNASEEGGIFYINFFSSLDISFSKFYESVSDTSGGVVHLSYKSTGNVTKCEFIKNRAHENGGVISITEKSSITLNGSIFAYNQAETGAALAANIKSSIFFDGAYTEIFNNTAKSGGAIYLDNSMVCFRATTSLKLNHAQEYGGGIHAIDSRIGIKSSVYFEHNHAENGGAIYFIRSEIFDLPNDENVVSDVWFILNEAKLGGAIFIDDTKESQSGICSNDINLSKGNGSLQSGCFFEKITGHIKLNFYNNKASNSSQDLFGGLLDRCSYLNTTYYFRSAHWSIGSAKTRFKEISNVSKFDTVTSKPVRVCHCHNEKLNCEKHPHRVEFKRGDMFSIWIAAVDQVGKMVSATISSNLSDNLLPVDQTIRNVGAGCSKLDYHVLFPDKPKDYKLTVFAKGPCKSRGISSFIVDIHVRDCRCAPGFMQEDTKSKCSCICDKRDKNFSKYIKECNRSTDSVIRKGTFWISLFYDSDNLSTTSYFIYPYCPLDYCKPSSESVNVKLDLPNGSDAQCVDNRGGILCGKCLMNYSVSLGSSKCIECPENWYGQLVGIIIGAIFAGIILVLLILVLNLTVAVGTLNSIIFYANIIYASKSIYLGQSNSSPFVSVFISWLNLGFAFDVCFFEGMDAYTKTWVQLVFPSYVIVLVFVVIWISSCSSKFSHLIGRKDPVATLATLILLSYTKLLQTVITSFSDVILEFPNRTISRRWLPDAGIEFCYGKHIALFSVSIIILFLGLFYTVLIFSKQWLVHCPRSKLFKSIRLYKLHYFIDTYHIPHTVKHRYWTGLLLLVRVTLYLITAFTASHNPRVTFLFTAIIMCLLLLYKSFLKKRLYKNKLISAMESFTCLNIVTLAIVTWYTSADGNGETLRVTFVNISVYTMFILFLMVISYHIYRYTNAKVHSIAKNNRLIKKIEDWLFDDQSEANQSQLDGDIYKLFGAIDSIRESSGYTPPSIELQEEPTRSVVSFTSCNELLASEYSNKLQEREDKN